mmetsp:Transcript_14708/g.38997  ORF Transcript_14708/g.38997 Transcript_14708/m.38997 type:complete len:268 (+) Transcript_14708:276-1079(+)
MVVQARVHHQPHQHQLGHVRAPARLLLPHGLVRGADPEALRLRVRGRRPEDHPRGDLAGRGQVLGDHGPHPAGGPHRGGEGHGQALVLVPLGDGGGDGEAEELQGDLLPGGGLEPEHAAEFAHVERHGHVEQLPLPHQGEPARGRHRSLVRAPDHARQRAGWLDDRGRGQVRGCNRHGVRAWPQRRGAEQAYGRGVELRRHDRRRLCQEERRRRCEGAAYDGWQAHHQHRGVVEERHHHGGGGEAQPRRQRVDRGQGPRLRLHAVPR